MIIIGDAPLALEELETLHQWRQIEKPVLLELARSPVPYTYSSETALTFEVKMRSAIVQSAYRLNQSGASFSTFSETRGNPVFWEVTARGGLRLKRGKNAAQAIDDILRNGYLYGFECATAIVVIYYGALLQVIGHATFNEKIKTLLLFSWHTDRHMPLLSERAHDLLLGDVRYIKNPVVDPLHPEWQGENLVYMGENLFFGHGIGIKPAEEIIAIVNSFQPTPDSPSSFMTNNVTRPNFQAISQLLKRSCFNDTDRITSPTLTMTVRESQSYFDYLIIQQAILIKIGETPSFAI